MHELPATQGMLDVALEAAEAAGATSIQEIHLVIGTLTSIVDDSVQFYFDLLAHGTPAEGATLVFHRESARLDCGACGHTCEVVPPLPRSCPTCESLQLRVTGGDAFRVESLEVDDHDTPASDIETDDFDARGEHAVPPSLQTESS